MTEYRRRSETARVDSYNRSGTSVKRTQVVLIAIFLAFFTTPGWAAVFSFSTGNPDGKLGALSQQASSENNQIETETADDFILSDATVINSAIITGLIIPLGASPASITNIEVELYHVFPADSGPASGKVPTRQNSPADVEIGTATRDGSAGTLAFNNRLVNSSFMVTSTVVNQLQPKTGGEGSATGKEVQIAITFTAPYHSAGSTVSFESLFLSSGSAGDGWKLSIFVRAQTPKSASVRGRLASLDSQYELEAGLAANRHRYN
jgi:hypothetical protein